jgi:hypothetical protein
MAERRNVRQIKIARMEGRLAEIFSPADVRREIPRIHYASWFLHKHPEHFIQLTPPYHRPALYRLRYPDITCIRQAGIPG